jgi:hypothetical protein
MDRGQLDQDTKIVIVSVGHYCIGGTEWISMANEESDADLQYAQTAGGGPPSPSDVSSDPVTPQAPGTADHNGWSGEPWQEYHGNKRLPEHNVYSAAKELAAIRERCLHAGDSS